jgi:ATP-binding cassette, subfamily B, multidrug efflux pump
MLKSVYTAFERLVDPFQTDKNSAPPATVLAFYLYFVRQVWPYFALLFVVSVLYTFTEVAVFQFIARIVDVLASTQPDSLWAMQGQYFLIMAAVIGLGWPLLNAASTLIIQQILRNNLPTLIRWQSHRHVVRQSISFFNNDYAGRVANKVVETGGSIRDTLITLTDAIVYVVVYVSSAVFLFTQADWRLILPLMVWFCLYAALSFNLIPKLRKGAEIASEARSTMVGRIVDSYTNMQTVKLFANLKHEDNYIREALDTNNRSWWAQARLNSTLDIVVTFLNALMLVATAALALWLWTQGAITAGVIALSLGLTQRIIAMSTWVMFLITGLFENIGTTQNGMLTIARPHSVVDVTKASELSVPHGEIRFESVNFAYPVAANTDNDTYALRLTIKDFNLNLKSGEKLGLVGPSGAGKSTLVNILLRLYDLKTGQILIDGQDIAHVTQESLRAHIGMVSQDTSLLHRSIAENIRYGRIEATDDELIEAAKRAHAHDFILELEDNKGNRAYEAQVGERGVKLSGGQRQRIAIARVLLKNAPILVLDEATSALDSEVETAIQDSLNELMRDKTVIAIAHRLSTIARMDRLVVMDKGRILETGSHAELLNKGGLYARLWAHQTGGFLAEKLDELI